MMHDDMGGSMKDTTLLLYEKYPQLRRQNKWMRNLYESLHQAMKPFSKRRYKTWHQLEHEILMRSVTDIYDPHSILYGCYTTRRAPMAVFDVWVELMWKKVDEGDMSYFNMALTSLKKHAIIN